MSKKRLYQLYRFVFFKAGYKTVFPRKDFLKFIKDGLLDVTEGGALNRKELLITTEDEFVIKTIFILGREGLLK